MRAKSYLTAAVTLFVLLLSVPVQAAQKNEFRLTVYGMVCNQCAYGVEQTLQHTKGVKDAIVDLKNGSVIVLGDPLNSPSAEILAQKIVKQRVSMEKIEATLVGRIVRTNDKWQLIVGTGRYVLDPPSKLVLDEFVGQIVTVEGIFSGIPGVDGAKGSPRLIPQSVVKLIEAQG